MSTISGQIKLNNKTSNHPESLRSQGYKVDVNDGVATVEGTSVVEGPVDLSTPEKAVKSFQTIVREKQLCTYGTRFLFPDGKTRFSFPAILALTRSESLRNSLGFDPSCLVTNVRRASKKSQIAFPQGVSKRREKREWLAEQLGISPAGLSLGALTKQFLEREQETPEPAPQPERTVTQKDVESLERALADLRARMSETHLV